VLEPAVLDSIYETAPVGLAFSDLYTRVTERVVAELERGARPWLKPWASGSTHITRPRRHNGRPYRGINVLLLWGEAIDRGYNAPLWMTYRQALELGAHVRQGEHGTTVVYAEPHGPEGN
jgi:antirestriction protein ArdC